MDEKPNQQLALAKQKLDEMPTKIHHNPHRLIQFFYAHVKPLMAKEVKHSFPEHGYSNLHSALYALGKKGYLTNLGKTPGQRALRYELSALGKSVILEPEKYQIDPLPRKTPGANRKTRDPNKNKKTLRPLKPSPPQNELFEEPQAPDLNLSNNGKAALDSISALIQQNDQYRTLFTKIQALINEELKN